MSASTHKMTIEEQYIALENEVIVSTRDMHRRAGFRLMALILATSTLAMMCVPFANFPDVWDVWWLLLSIVLLGEVCKSNIRPLIGYSRNQRRLDRFVTIHADELKNVRVR